MPDLPAPSTAPAAAAAPTTIPGLYLYGIITGAEPLPAALTGLAGSPLAIIEHAGIAALVSAPPAARLRPERRHLAAHQGVLQSVARACTLLPMAFGVVAPSEAAVRDLLDEHAEELRTELESVRGRVEMTVRLSLDPTLAVRAYVDDDADLKRLAAQIAAGAGHEVKMRAGRRFEALMNERREHALAALSAGLAPVSAELRPGTLRTERDLVNLAALVQRERLPDFEAAVHAVAAQFDDRHALDFSGPWPAFSFVDVRLSLAHAGTAR